MTHPQTIKIISLEDFIKQAKADAVYTVEADSDKCEGCPNLAFDRDIETRQTIIECAGVNDDECLQLVAIVEEAEIEYEKILSKLEKVA